MNLKMGLVFKKEDALPVENLVRFYTDSIISYLNGTQINHADYYNYGVGRQGYVDYNLLVSAMEKEGLNFCGHKTYEEFKEKILSKVKFDISVSVDLSLEKEVNMIKKLEC